ncbi:MAG: glutamine amidotransferase [Phycisphaerales bacterium]
MLILPLASIQVGPIQFDAPVWLFLIPVLALLSVLMGMKSLAGLGSTTRWVALGARLLVLVLIVGALAEPQWRTETKDVSVTVVLDASESVPSQLQNDVKAYVEAAASEGRKKVDDRLGLVTAARDAFVQTGPTKLTTRLEQQHIGAIDGTDLAKAVNLAIALLPADAANRIILASDGNETAGNVLQAAEAAKALGIPIDVLPLKYRYENEVLVERLAAPASAREGENVAVKIVLRAVQPAEGRLVLMLNGNLIASSPVTLKPGLNTFTQLVATQESGPQNFQAVFEPMTNGGRVMGDSVVENNQSEVVTFVSGEAKVLVLVDGNPEGAAAAAPLLEVLAASKIKTEVRDGRSAPGTLTEWNAYDAVIMINQEAYPYSQKQQEELRQYVHDTGGGILMVGGPQAFGAGGWIGSPLEDALPIKLDPPQKRQMPRGALALVMHSVEMPEGVYYGKKVCEQAVNALSRLDLAGIVEYGWNGTTEWVHPLAVIGDGSAIKRSIQKLMFGDMPDFSPSLELAYEGLSKAEAGQRHVIMISDGDPSPPSTTLLDKYVKAGISISTVGVFPHGGGDTSRMEFISRYTKGRHYHVDTQKALAELPQIFIKEAQTVRRSLIWEGPAFQPTMVGFSETMRGLTAVPPIRGYVVAAEREGLSVVSLKGKEGDPILAQWQYGLGKVVTYTSDAATRWNPAWMEWGSYKAFWEQHVRWAMRPAGNGNVRVVTENKGDQTVVTMEAFDAKGERLNFAVVRGRLATPDGKGVDVALRQIGPGRYSASVPTDQAGSYLVNLQYAAPDPEKPDQVLEGTVQAAISRPFADEYRTLEDNTPLLAQVAEMTGGRVLTGDPKSDRLWTREGLKMPVATEPIWLYVALIGMGLFLMDVGVRRVRVDLRAMSQGVLALFGKGKTNEGGQMAGLKAARAQAQARMTDRGAGQGAAELTAEAKRAVAEAEKKARETAKVKFEARPDQLKKPTTDVALGGADAQPQILKSKARPSDDKAAPPAPGEGMSRLLKAKKKAQDDMQE